MASYKKAKYIHQGCYVAEVEVELVDSDDSWSPCLTLEAARRLDAVRDALNHGDLVLAATYGNVYELRPIAKA